MATFEYVDIPAEATRLGSSPEDLLSHSVRPADKIPTSFPDSSTATIGHFRFIAASHPSNPTAASSPSKTALSIIPQLLLSSSIPTSAASITSNASGSMFGTTKFTAMVGQTSHTYLSTHDPLSLSTMTTNFRRFVAKVGPLFWLQDRIEEIILWKKGWKRTTVWLAAYGFICEHMPLPLYLTLRIRLLPEIDITPSSRAVVGHNATIPPRTRFAPCADFRE